MNSLARAVALLVVGLPLAAQDPAPTPPATEPAGTSRKWGVGVSLSPVAVFIEDSFGVLPFGFTNILVPIKVSPNTTFEPEIGLFRSSAESGGFSTSLTNFRLGFGLLLGLQERGGIHPYIGPRFGLGRTTTKSDGFGGSTSTKQTSWQFSGVIGAQHFFSPHFSLGGEAQLTRASVGDQETTPTPPGGTSENQTFITTVGVISLRWFF